MKEKLKNQWLVAALLLFIGLTTLLLLKQTGIIQPSEKFDEALIRTPIPPYPDPEGSEIAPTDESLEEESIIVQNESDVAEEESLKTEESAEVVAVTPLAKTETKTKATYQRDLTGTEFVPSAVSNPSIECAGGSTKDMITCYGGYLTTVVEKDSIEAAFIKLKEMYNDKDAFTVSNCHQLTHVIGRAATLVFPTVAEAYNYGDTFCWSGYYHGIMEAIIAEIGLEEVPKRLNDICSTIPGKDEYSFNYFNCVHGLGHGVMYVEAHDLFKALALCDSLTGNWERSSCYGGVFMENVIANEIDHVSKFLKDDDLLYPCNAVGENYKQQCYLMHTSHMLKINGYNFEHVFLECQQADPGYVTTCYQSIGRDASGFSSSDREVTAARCLLGPDYEAQSNCITGAVKDFISYFHSDVQAIEFCNNLPEEHVESCLKVGENYYKVF